MRNLHHRNRSLRSTLAFHSLVLLSTLFAPGCGRFYLSGGVARSPAVAAADNSTSGPSTTATVWVEAVEPGFVRVVGKVFDNPDSVSADAAPVKSLSDPIATVAVSGVLDATDAVSGLDVVRTDAGFFVVWQEKGLALFSAGPTWGLFTDTALNPIGSPILLFDHSPVPAPSQGRNEIWVFYVYYVRRVVVLTIDSPQLNYAVLDSDTRELRNVSQLPGRMLRADVSYEANPNRSPFMVTYLEAEGDLDDPFRVRAAFFDFYDSLSEYLSLQCVADVSHRSSHDFNNTAGASHPSGDRYVVWDERDGDVFGTFVRDDCAAGFETYLGTRSIASASGGSPSGVYFPMDVRFDERGNGLVAMKQALASNLVSNGITYVVSVLPLRFDGLRMSGRGMRPIGLAQRQGVPYSNRTFQLRSDVEGFKLVFDEVAIEPNSLAIPSRWRVLFGALDARGVTL